MDCQLPDALLGDPLRIRQILFNLLGNAIKFTDRGKIALQVKVAEEANNQVQLRFEVRDTGIGIPPEFQSNIFDSFSQADETTVRRYGRAGLGLAISKQLVEMMGGNIGLQSAPGIGSTFWFIIPLEKQDDGRVKGWRLGQKVLVSIPCHLEPYVRFSLIRLSDNLPPGAFKAMSCIPLLREV